MKLLQCVTLVLLVICFCADGAFSQLVQADRDRMQVESRIGLSRILSMGGVEKELEMTENQSLDVAGLWSQVQYKIRSLVKEYESQLKQADASEADALKQEFEKRFEAIREEELSTVSKVLLPFQLERLKEIQVQYMKQTSQGMGMALAKLELTDQQQAQLKQIREDLVKELKNKRPDTREEDGGKDSDSGQSNQDSIAAQVTQAKAQALADAMNVLTKKQRDELASREGASFEFAKPKERTTSSWLE